jgi:4-hydroxy-tetrahydrodipicolinate reductase
MGGRLVALGSADPELKIVAALEYSACPRLGEDAGAVAGIGPIGVPLTDKFDAEADCVIDFSTPAGMDSILAVCLEKKLPLVLATTGLEPAQIDAIQSAAKTIPILYSPNTSLAVNLAMKLSEVAAGALADHDADVEILERHHRFKEDSPSGTALKFGQLIAAKMGQTSETHGRDGRPGPRPHVEIGYHAIRTGDNPGEHTIVFGMLGETVEVTVRASNRDCYAFGALSAAKFLTGKSAALYTMNDLLQL